MLINLKRFLNFVIAAWSKIDDTTNLSVVEPTNPWANLNTQNTATSEDGWADFGSFTTDFSAAQFPDKNANATISDTPESTTATTSVTTTQDVQSSGDQKTSEEKEQEEHASENNSTATTEEKLEQMKDEKIDNHPAEPVSIEDNSKLISPPTSPPCPMYVD